MTPRPRRLPRLVALALVVVTATGAAATYESASTRIRGEIASVEGDRLTIRARDGSTVRVQLAAGHQVTAVLPADLESVEPGAFVGAAAVPQPDGRLEALEVAIFPEAMRGAGEGHYPWDLSPESTMTNATIDAVAGSGPDGSVLTLTYPGGEATVVVPPGTPVVRLEPGDAGLLQPGSHVFIPVAERQPDGALLAAVVAVGRDGLVPPM
ncbi:MAG TPA: hypothetical protein VFG47_03320 [Geminicoccaceae bacterium]|nr:hypothetical protein [Geminicoccaceae bacterium]